MSRTIGPSSWASTSASSSSEAPSDLMRQHNPPESPVPCPPTNRLRQASLLLFLWAGLTGVLIAIGFGVVHSSTLAAFDRHVTSTVVAHRTPALDAAMKAVTWLGSWVALVVSGLLVFGLAIRRRLPWLALLLAAVAWAGEAAGVWLAKHVVQRQRPPADLRLISAHGWSWPSGHMAVAVLVFMLLALVATHFFRSPVVRVVIWAVAVVAVAAVGFSRIELGVHWTTDVLASLVFVSGWVVAMVALFARELRVAQGPGSRASSMSEDGGVSHGAG